MNPKKVAQAIISSIEQGGRVLICGNGGSLAESTHFAEELVAKFEKERLSLPAIALNDASTITAIANDTHFKYVFSRQIEGLGQKGDVLVTLSTSGTSKNILQAQVVARKMGLVVIPFPTNEELNAPTYKTQETHLKWIHKICREVENHYVNSN